MDLAILSAERVAREIDLIVEKDRRLLAVGVMLATTSGRDDTDQEKSPKAATYLSGW